MASPRSGSSLVSSRDSQCTAESRRLPLPSYRSQLPLPHQLCRHRQVVRGFDRPGARGADLPAVVGEDVIDLLVPVRKRRTDRLRGELRDVLAAELPHLRRIRTRVEIAGEDIRVAAGADLPREAAQLFRPDLRVETPPRREVRGVDVDHGPIDADRRLEERPRLADAWQRMHLRLHDLAAGEDRVAISAPPPDVARGEVTVEAGARLELRELIAKARLPGLSMHFLQGHDVRVEAPDRLGDVPHMIAVDQLVVARDVVGHHDQRPARRRQAGPLRKADELAVLLARQQAKTRVGRPRKALAGTDGIDGEDAVDEDQKENGEHAEDQPSLRGHHRRHVLHIAFHPQEKTGSVTWRSWVAKPTASQKPSSRRANLDAWRLVLALID